MKKEVPVSKNCRDTINKLHEIVKSLELAKVNLEHRDKAYTKAAAFLWLWIGFAVTDFIAAATVVYTISPITGIRVEHVFWNPEGGVFMNFTWFGLGLVVSLAFALISLCYVVICSLSYRAARKKIEEINEGLKKTKSAILEVCPMELWYSGEA